MTPKLTNKYNLPQPLVDLVSFDDYTPDGADYSTTGLIGPPRIRQLRRRFWKSLTEDVSDGIWRMSGHVKHVVLERIAKINPARYIVEKRYFETIDGFKVGGRIDLFDREPKTLYDWKETSIWKAKVGDDGDWRTQSNINALLMRRSGETVDALANIGLLKDWKSRDARYKKDYPPCPIQIFPLPMWPEEKTLAYISGRIKLHEEAKASEQLPLCTEQERWFRPGKWAVKRKGLKKAERGGLKDNEKDAREMAESLALKTGKQYEVEERPGENIRCLYFCSVAQFCDFGLKVAQEAKEKQLTPEPEEAEI